MRALRLAIPVILTATTAATSAAQGVRARIVDQQTRQPLVGAVALLLSADSTQVATGRAGSDGFLEISAPLPGQYTILVTHDGFEPFRQAVSLREGTATIPAVLLMRQVFELDCISVVSGAPEVTPAPGGFQRSSHILAGSRLATLEMHGGRLLTAVRELSSLRTREWMENGRLRTCVESVRAATTGEGLSVGGTAAKGRDSEACRWVALVIDGVWIGEDPERDFRYLRLSEFESVEYLPPSEAALRYGMKAAVSGALLLWSRGRGPYVSSQRDR